MQQIGLLAVEATATTRELVTWCEFNVNTQFSWALHPLCLKGNFTRAHRVSFARAMADNVVDQVLSSFSCNSEFNKAFDEACFALDTNCIEPAGVVKLTHTALRQTIDMQFMMVSQTIIKELGVPVVPWSWLQSLVAKKDVDLDDEHVVKLRGWINCVIAGDQFLFHTTFADGPKRVVPYVSSPGGEGGNVSDTGKSMLRVDNAGGTPAYAIADNMLKYMTEFYASSNIDREARNLVPALDRHAVKSCDFEAMFNMTPVCNVTFFLGLLFTATEMRQMPAGLFVEALDDKPTVGLFTRNELPREGSKPWTAYGIHVVAAIIIASFLSTDTPNTPECQTVVASKITKELMKHAPTTMLHPSGTHLLCRGFTGKSVRHVSLDVEPRVDRVQAAFFHRPRNDTSLMNATPSMSMLDSQLQPYILEDTLHTRWIPFMLKSHLSLVQEWDQICVLYGCDVIKRKVRVNDRLGDIVLSDLYRSLDTSLLPCNDTLVYGVHYPIVGVGIIHTAADQTWRNVQGWVCLHDAIESEVHVFATQATERPDEGFGDDGKQQPLGDQGCNEQHYKKATADIFQFLRAKSMLVMPLVNRPGAVLYHPDWKFGTLAFDVETGRCYNPVDGCYTMRVPNNVESSIDSPVGNEIKIRPIELETMLLGVPTHVFVDMKAFVVDDVKEQFVPMGCDPYTSYLKCNLWYPSQGCQWVADHVYILAHVGGINSSSFTLIDCDVSWLFHPDDKDGDYEVVTSVQSCGD